MGASYLANRICYGPRDWNMLGLPKRVETIYIWIADLEAWVVRLLEKHRRTCHSMMVGWEWSESIGRYNFCGVFNWTSISTWHILDAVTPPSTLQMLYGCGYSFWFACHSSIPAVLSGLLACFLSGLLHLSQRFGKLPMNGLVERFANWPSLQWLQDWFTFAKMIQIEIDNLSTFHKR